MKMNYDLFREILMFLEVNDRPYLKTREVLIPGYSEDAVAYHVGLLGDAGLLEVSEPILIGGYHFAAYTIHRMTMAGHQYLAAIRNESVWEKTKNKLSRVGGEATIDIVKALAVSFLKEML